MVVGALVLVLVKVSKILVVTATGALVLVLVNVGKILVVT